MLALLNFVLCAEKRDGKPQKLPKKLSWRKSREICVFVYKCAYVWTCLCMCVCGTGKTTVKEDDGKENMQNRDISRNNGEEKR